MLAKGGAVACGIARDKLHHFSLAGCRLAHN
jgi:hypothetical protein